jgi:hypothetical protein
MSIDVTNLDAVVEHVARAVYVDSCRDKAAAFKAWDDMGGSEPSAERADLEATVYCALWDMRGVVARHVQEVRAAKPDDASGLPRRKPFADASRGHRTRRGRRMTSDLGTLRFAPTNDQLRKSLLWHAEVTLDLQRRIVEARHYVNKNGIDPRLLAILDTPARSKGDAA